jgi:hypothetical protein
MNTISPAPARSILLQVGSTLFFGLIVCVFSLNGVLRNIGNKWPGTKIGDALVGLASVPNGIYDALPGGKYFLLELLVRWVLLSLAVFVCLLLLNSIRHQTVNIFVSGTGGLLIGLFALTWISLLVFLGRIVFICVAWLFGMLQWIIAGILSFLFWAPVLYTLVGVGAVVGVIVLVALLKDLSLEDVLDWLKGLIAKLSVKPLLAAAGAVAAAALVWFVLVPLWREYITPLLMLIAAWLSEYVAPILTWILSAIVVLILSLLALAATVVVLFILGRQFIDQFKSAHTCGRDMHSAFAAGFAVGAAAGLALLICSTNDEYRAVVNASWAGTSPIFADADVVAAVYAFMPRSAEALLQGLFTKASLPIFDTALLVATLLLANCSLLMGLLSGVTVEPLRRLFSRERMPPLFNLMFGLLVACAVIALDATANQDS